jgi:UDP-N-acetylmuramoyl-tripeptide--D-alanyl-D-alanine ligase
VVSKLSVIILVLGVLEFGHRRILTFLRYFQQEEYSTTRFTTWIRERRAIDTRGTAILASVGLLSIFFPGEWLSLLFSVLGAGALICVVRVLEEDPRRSGKIKLNMTQRASKITLVAFGCYAIAALIPIVAFCPSCCGSSERAVAYTALWGLVLVHSPALFLIIANKILWPAERALQERYYRDAQRILREVHPFVIGITGSYGKTGAKAALGDLLTQCLGPTFWPRKSINTVMGITRTIRETLKPYHRYAVIEMGAYQKGSIRRLCDFTPPQAALVTAVGIMHLERFGSPENVYLAKSEIAQAVPADGILVCNGDSPNARRMASEHKRATTLLYGLDQSAGPLDCYASDLSFDERGTSFTIHWRGESFRGRTPLLGRPALSNALGAFTMACALGASPAYAVACMANLEPVDNRLVFDRKPGTSFLRDAYNSNPTGFAAALEVLKDLPAKRRIVMTPGMIELGDQQSAENRRLAAMCAGVADMVIVVGRVNREAILAGLSDAAYPQEKIVTVDSRAEAFETLSDREQPGDLVLIENDLGDLHEGAVRL